MSKIITIYSVVQGNGAKFVATNLSNSYKKLNPDAKVALVDFDFRYPFLASAIAPQDEIHGIDNLIEKIDGQFLDKSLFEENMIHLKNGVHLLKGTKLQNKHSLIERSHIEKVIECVKQIYDLTIIVANSDFDNSGSIYSAIHSDEIILIGQANYSTYLNLGNVCKKVNHYSQINCKKWFLYNKFYESKHVDLKDSIIKNSLTVLGVVPLMNDAIDNIDLKDNAIKSFLGGNRQNRNETNVFDEIMRKL